MNIASFHITFWLRHWFPNSWQVEQATYADLWYDSRFVNAFYSCIYCSRNRCGYMWEYLEKGFERLKDTASGCMNGPFGYIYRHNRPSKRESRILKEISNVSWRGKELELLVWKQCFAQVNDLAIFHFIFGNPVKYICIHINYS